MLKLSARTELRFCVGETDRTFDLSEKSTEATEISAGRRA